ncbi:MAG TPA: CsgG/HfaB family protein [Rhodanobacteraceae bacterium]|nr:CsgG/HfaB family protein [Rhodanobacteraceae bacterium]
MKRSAILYAFGALALATSAGALARGGRPSVAVIDFTNDGSGASWFHGDVGHQLAGVLSNELTSTGDFNVVERQKVNAVLNEQDFASSGRVRRGTGPRTGNITGAKYLITGTVTSYTENTSDTGGGVSFAGFHVGGDKSEAYVAIDLRVVDAETSEVVFSRSVEGRSSDSSVDVGGSTWRGLGGDFHHSRNAPASKAVRAALVEASNYLDCAMVRRDGCMASFDAKERRRRHSDADVLNLDGG